MAIESERKYLDAPLNEIRKRLSEMGAASKGMHFETNIVLDDADRSFVSSDKLIRARKREYADKTDCLFTVKLPSGKNATHDCKIREELEIEAGDCGVLVSMLGILGYCPIAVYEKVRESWILNLPGENVSVKVDLDFLPFCHVVEIEGKPEQIDMASSLLGIDKLKTSIKSYHMLHQDWLESTGQKTEYDILFKPEEKKRLRKLVGLSN